MSEASHVIGRFKKGFDMSRRYKVKQFGGLWQVVDTKSKSRCTNQFCSCIVKWWAVKIASALNTIEARPTVRAERPVQQRKVRTCPYFKVGERCYYEHGVYCVRPCFKSSAGN